MFSQDSLSTFVRKILISTNRYQPNLRESSPTWLSNLMSASAIRFVFFSGNGLLASLEFRAVKRKLFSAPVKYTLNGMSTSHPVIPSFKLLIDGDLNPNPGQDDNNNTQASQVVIELPKSGLRIGQWNNSRLTNSKCEQIKFFLTS